MAAASETAKKESAKTAEVQQAPVTETAAPATETPAPAGDTPAPATDIPASGSVDTSDSSSLDSDMASGVSPSTSPPGSGAAGKLSRSLSESSDSTGNRSRNMSGGSGGRARTFSACSIGSYNRAVILAVDHSETAKYAFEWFLENIHRPDDLLVLVHCPEAPRLPTLSFKSPMAPPVDEWKKILDEMNSKTRKLEEDYEGTCIQKKLKYKVRGETMKHPGEGIVKIGDEEKAALICMGTRGLSGVKRSLLGSVSDYVVRHSSIPTVIVPRRKGSA